MDNEIPTPSNSHNSHNTHHPSSSRNTFYAPQFKEKVLSYVSSKTSEKPQMSFASASEKFKVHPTTISEWVKESSRQENIQALLAKELCPQFSEEGSSNEPLSDENEFRNVVATVRKKFLLEKKANMEITILINEMRQELQTVFEKRVDKELSSWVDIWWKKFKENHSMDLTGNETSQRISKYPEWFKDEVVAFAAVLGQRVTSRIFCIAQRRVFDWVHSQSHSDAVTPETSGIDEIFQKVEPSLQSKHQVLNFEIEQHLYNWVQEQLPTRVSSTRIREKGMELYRAKGYMSMQCSYGWYRRWASRFNISKSESREETDDIILTWVLQQQDQNIPISVTDLQQYALTTLTPIRQGFQASAGWATRFFKRHHVRLNWDDLCDEPLPTKLENDKNSFQEFATNVSSQYATNRIGTFDEIPLSFSELSVSDQVQVASRPRKYTILNCDATVILTLLADGTLLPPLVIIKGQNISDMFQIYSQEGKSVVAYYCESTEPSLKCLEKWYEIIWTESVGNCRETLSILFLDDYKLHNEFKDKYNSDTMRIEMFPSGCACKLQPLKYSVTRHFLKYMEHYWQQHIQRASEKTTVDLPSTDEIIEWVSESYEKLKENQKDILTQAFTKAKLTP